jgi:hypothetical protein
MISYTLQNQSNREIFKNFEPTRCPLNLAKLLIYYIILLCVLFITLIIIITYPHFSLVGKLVSRHMMVNYRFL